MKLNVSLLTIALSSGLSVADGRQNLALRRSNKECPDGFSGSNCKDDVDECQASPYPCAGGNKRGSFCVDYDPPQKFKCGCLPGYDAILPTLSDVEDNVPVEWRPLKCLARDVCVGFVCHEDATCTISTNNTAVCVCNNDLTGDGITICSPVPNTVVKKPVLSASCKTDSDCTKLENSRCVDALCKCKAGFYHSNGKGQCINENECAEGYPNHCHKNAICKDTEGSYTCACQDGYRDLNPSDSPGRICMQINECADAAMHNCNDETQVCVDLPPPSKWQCVERTPAPTPVPTTTLAPKCQAWTPPQALCLANGFPDTKLCTACTFLDLSPFSSCQAATATDTSISGCIPSEIGLLTWLTSLDLREYYLIGTIPTQIGMLTLLEKLILRRNQLTGTIPTQIGLMTALTYLTFGSNQLSGKIPTEFGKLTNLEYLSIRRNELKGTIPTEIGLMTSLVEALNLYENQLAGTIPTQIGKLTLLSELSLHDNELKGTIPSEIGKLAALTLLTLGGNKLQGTIPTEIALMASLNVLYLYHNLLTGTIPTEIWLTTIEDLDLHENKLIGTIPTEIGKFTSAFWVYLADNQLVGTIPPEIALCKNMEALSLRRNQLNGKIPTELLMLTSLDLLALDENKFTGDIPTEIGLLTLLQLLDLSKNQLTGGIPSEIGMLHKMAYMDLSENKLSGPIPVEIAGIDTTFWLEILALYGNDLTGIIPGAIDDPAIAVYIDCGEISCINCIDKDGAIC